MRVNFVLVFVWTLFWSSVVSQNSGNCDISDIPANQWSIAKSLSIDDTQVNTAIFESDYSGTLEIGTLSVTSNTGNIDDDAKIRSYFNFTKDEETSKVFLYATSEFANLDEDAYTNGSSTLIINLAAGFTCTGGTSTLRLVISITDTNTYAPSFLSTTYEYKVPMPIMSQVDFSIYGDPVEATDLDFSNTGITFDITPQDFTISTTKIANKTFRAVFSTVNILQLTESKKYTLTATDTGNPTKSSSTSLTITIDPTVSLDSPSFLSNPYRFNYTISDGAAAVVGNEVITAKTNKPSSITNVTLNGDYKDNFKVTPTNDDSNEQITFDISVETPLPSTVESITVLTLSFETDAQASTTILVYTSSDEEVPQFDRLYYTGSYSSSDNTVALENEIKVTSSSTPTVTVSGDYSSHFNVSCDGETNCKLTVTDLQEEISKTTEIILTLTAKLDNGQSSQSLLVIKIPSENLPAFSKVYYVGKYTVTDDVGQVELEDDIEFENIDSEKMDIVFELYNETFKMEYTDSKWTVTVRQSLANDVLTSNTLLGIILTASEKSNPSITTKSVLGLELPELTSSDTPTFKQLYYTGSYKKDDHTVELDKQIEISSSNIPSVVISGEHSENFKVVCTSTTCELTADALSDTILASNSELLLTMTATEEGSTNQGEAVLLIKLPGQLSLSFSQLYYTGTYSVTDGQASVALSDQIYFDNYDSDSISIDFGEPYNGNFKAEYNNNKWTIFVSTPLSDEKLSNKELFITLTAKYTVNTTISAEALLILTLPEVKALEAPVFSAAYYVADYVINDDKTVDITANTEISISNKNDMSAIDISLDSFKENFEITWNSSSSKWDIAIKSSLDDNTLQFSTELRIVLTAKEESNANTGYTVWIVTLPQNSTNSTSDTPVFSKRSYSAEYLDTNEVTLSNIIQVKYEGDLTVSFQQSTYSENFKIEPEDNHYNVVVKTALSSEVLQSEVSIVLTVVAEADSATGYATLVINLPKETNIVPAFSQPSYSAAYLTDGSLQMTDNIKVTYAGEEVLTVEIEDGSNNFEIKQDSDHYTLSVKLALTDDVLQTDASVILTLVAKTETTSATAYATVVINLPKSTTATVFPEFSQVSYTAEYSSLGTLDMNDIISVKYTGSDNIQVTISDGSDNFAIDQDGDHYKLSVKTPLSDEVLQSAISLVLTLAAQVENSNTAGYATVVINLPIKVNTSVITFGQVLYSADYNPDSGEGTLANIGVDIDSTNDVELTLSNDHGLSDDYFAATYADSIISVSLKQAFPEEFVKNNSFVALTITVGIKGTTDTSSVVLNVRLIGGGVSVTSSINTTGYIAAISVLAVLLVAVIAAAIVLYYLKFRAKSYSQMDDESPKPQVKFSKNLARQNSDLKPPSAIEARRPTGFVFTPTSLDADKLDVDNEESSSDTLPGKERRKSVAFDPNIEELHIDTNNDAESVGTASDSGDIMENEDTNNAENGNVNRLI